MKKLPKSKLSAAIIKWSNDFDNFWLHRYLRSLGYTLDEVIELSDNDLDIGYSIMVAYDSIFEKVMYKIADRTFTPEAADFALKIYSDYLYPKRRKPPNNKYYLKEKIKCDKERIEK
jgi:hypothetical protein